jgi:hypothetical protein
MSTITTTRNAGLTDLLETLSKQQMRKLDVVAPATAILSQGGVLRVTGTEPVLNEDGVSIADGLYRPTVVADENLAAKLGIPVAYLRRMRDERPDLYDANVNGWIHGCVMTKDGALGQTGDPDRRAFMLRLFRGGDDGEEGIARAVLSNSYKVMDNLDVLVSVLDGVREAGLNVEVQGGDLTDRRMVVRIVAPEVQALAPVLLRGYRSPFTGASGSENPTVFAGLQISNSEVGNGAFSITPRLVVQVCTNGMTITKDAMRSVHLGETLDHGVIRWSDETQDRNLALVKSKTVDAVRTFLDVDYMQRIIDRAEEKSETEIESVDRVKDVTKPLGYSQAHIDGILGHFVKGGQMTLGGVTQAITSYAQTVDGDAAFELESKAMDLLLA